VLHPFAPAGGPDLRAVFAAPQLQFVVDAMRRGNSPAAAWGDDTTRPRRAVVWDLGHNVYVGGDPSDASLVEDVGALLRDAIVPDVSRRGLGVLKVVAPDQRWQPIVPDLLAPLDVTTRHRTFLRLDPSAVDARATEVTGFRVQRITPTLLDGRRHAAELADEIGSCWTSPARFWELGFGFAALTEAGDIAGWCTAEYVGDRVCGVGVETVEEHQGLGVGTLTAGALARHCVDLGWTAFWDSWTANVPSVRLGRTAGFRSVLDYSCALVWLAEPAG
jgi:GNAT superfamily N-acetyltransferase